MFCVISIGHERLLPVPTWILGKGEIDERKGEPDNRKGKMDKTQNPSLQFYPNLCNFSFFLFYPCLVFVVKLADHIQDRLLENNGIKASQLCSNSLHILFSSQRD